MDEPLKTIEHRGLTIKIYADHDAESPREWDNLGTMVCWHRRYTLGDEQPSGSPSDYLASLLREDVAQRLERRSEREYQKRALNLRGEIYWQTTKRLGEEHNARVRAEVEKTHIILPLFLYDHSGITMRTSAFSCPWDSGQVGYIVVSLDKVRKEYSSRAVTKAIREKAVKCLEQEVETYSLYLEGGFTGYVVEDEDGENIDSCCGFDDPDYCIQQAKEAADYEADKRDAEQRDAAADGGAECSLEGGL